MNRIAYTRWRLQRTIRPGGKSVLILSRRIGESFYIGDNVKITVLSQRSNQVRIGIDAPRSLPVHREEVVRRQQQQARKEAAAVAMNVVEPSEC